MMTVTEASEHLAVNEHTIRAMLRRGTLKGFQDGRLIRVTVESVEALVNGRSLEVAAS